MSVTNPVPGATYGVTTIDFGTTPGSNEVFVNVTGQTGIKATSKVFAFIMADDTSVDHTANDHRFFGIFANLTCGTPTAGVGFTIYAKSFEKLTGNWTVRYF